MLKLGNTEVDFVVASGALGWDGGGWFWEKPLVKLGIIDPSLFLITTKTLTLNANRGNWFAVRPVRGGVWNNQGLPNKGLGWWLSKYYPFTDAIQNGRELPRHNILPYRTLLSLAPRDYKEIETMANMLSAYRVGTDPNFIGIEINVSCPNLKESLSFNTILNIVAESTECFDPDAFATVLKLNYQQAFYASGFTSYEIERFLLYVDAISLNSAPLPFEKGAYSGLRAQQFNWKTGDYLRDQLHAKVIYPSLWSYEDIGRAFERGADAVSFGAVHLLRPYAPTMWVRRYMREKQNV